MKPKSASSLSALAASALFLAGSSTPANAANLTWDAGNTANGATINAASGNWNLTVGNIVWNNAGTNVPWTQTSTTDASNAAIFAGADGTLNQYGVTLGAQMAAESLTFNSSGYRITGGTLAVMPTTTTNGAITVAADKTATIDSAIAYASNAAASITVNSGSTLNLGGGASNAQYTFTGAGTVNLTAGTYSANTGAVNVATFNQTGGTFNVTPGLTNGYNINSTTQNVAYNLSAGTLSVNSSGDTSATIKDNFLGIGNGTGANTSALNVSGTGIVNVGTTASRSGEIRIGNATASNGTLNVSGGTVTVGTGSAANQIYFFKAGSGAGFTAAMTQSGGTVTANGIQFGGDTGTYNAASSATLQLSAGSLYVGAEGMTRGSAAAALPVEIRLQGGTLGASGNWSSSLDMKLGTTGGGPIIRAANSGGTARNITLSGVLSNDVAVNGALIKSGTGTLFLNNDSNTFTGQALSDAGILKVTKLANGGTDSSLGAASSSIRLGNNATATLEYVGTTDSSTNRLIQIGTFTDTNTGSAAILNNSASGKLTFSASSFNSLAGAATVARTLTLGGSNTMDNAISGNIRDNNTAGGGTISVVKQDAGKWILSGTSDYTGTTDVTGGTLVVNGNISTSLLTTVSSGATIGGSGTVGALTVLGGGILAPGNSSGTLDTATLTLADTSVLGFELDPTDTTVGSNINDLISVTGNLTLNGILNVVATSGNFLAATAGTTWRLFGYTGTLTDNVVNLGSMPSLTGSLVWEIDTATAGQVNLMVIPEPRAALLGGLGLLVLMRRRRCS